MKTQQQLPKNIRQIGGPIGHTKVYVEDFVVTFLNALAMDHNTFVRGAILFGEKRMIENDTVIFIKGAIEGQNIELDLDETVFDDSVWREIYQQKDRYFPELEVMGWALSRMGFSVKLNDKIKKTHFENFPGEGKVLYMMDQLEKEDAFYVYRGQDLVRQNGYYIYYEKNQRMQEYLVDRNQKLEEVKSYESMMEARRDEKVIKQFRETVSKKTRATKRKSVAQKVTTAAAFLLVAGIMGSVYYGNQREQALNLKDAVEGAVETMGRGAQEQDDTESTQPPSTLSTKATTKATTRATTEAKKTTTAQSASTNIQTYIVKKGDTLVSISRKFYGTQRRVSLIKEANKLESGNYIYQGQKLNIPSQTN